MVAPPEYCPVSLAADLVAERWTLLIIREVLAGASRFNDIHRGLPGLSRTLLSQRLRKLHRAGLVEPVPGGGYRLTEAGTGLRTVLEALGEWAVRWCFPRPGDDQLNPQLLMWRIRSGIAADQLPNRRVVIQLDFTDHQPARGWLVLDGPDSSLCTRDPLFDIDLHASASSQVWHEVWHGHRELRDAIEAGELRLIGHPGLTGRFASWFRLGRFAGEVSRRS